MSCSCDICGNALDSDQNVYGICDENRTRLVLCSLHAEASIRISEDKIIDSQAMRLATLRLYRIRPSVTDEPEEWAQFSSLDELVRLYKDVSEGSLESLASSEQTGEKKAREMTITIPGEFVKKISDNNYIEKELLQLLAFCTGRVVIKSEPVSEISYDEFSNPVARTMHYGDRSYGLYMRAEPLTSGVGVHGEEAHWKFMGLPDGMEVAAQSRLDMRGGSGNFYGVKIEGDNINIGECISFLENIFALEIKKIVAV